VQHEDVASAGQTVPLDEDVNNKMFIVVRNLKSSSAKTVINFILLFPSINSNTSL
jgi:hypothetical protein